MSTLIREGDGVVSKTIETPVIERERESSSSCTWYERIKDM